jgi:hypothetical protein
LRHALAHESDERSPDLLAVGLRERDRLALGRDRLALLEDLLRLDSLVQGQTGDPERDPSGDHEQHGHTRQAAPAARRVEQV